MAVDYPHIEEHAGRMFISGTRVPVTTIAVIWNQGASPETLQQKFPSTTLAGIYSAIVYYLDHRDQIDQQIAEDEALFNTGKAAQWQNRHAQISDLEQRFAALRARRQVSAS